MFLYDFNIGISDILKSHKSSKLTKQIMEEEEKIYRKSKKTEELGKWSYRIMPRYLKLLM